MVCIRVAAVVSAWGTLDRILPVRVQRRRASRALHFGGTRRAAKRRRLHVGVSQAITSWTTVSETVGGQRIFTSAPGHDNVPKEVKRCSVPNVVTNRKERRSSVPNAVPG